jgi:hypothetical protein
MGGEGRRHRAGRLRAFLTFCAYLWARRLGTK